MELEEHVRNFREYHRNAEQTIGEFLVNLVMLWRKAKEGGITDFEASYRLLKEMPPNWTPWVRLQVWDTITYDFVTFAPSGHFIDLVSRVFLQWLKEDGPPAMVGDRERAPELEETYARALEAIYQARSPEDESRRLGKQPMEESSMESPPIWIGRHDYEAGPSRVEKRTLGIQTDIEEEAVPPVSQPQQQQMDLPSSEAEEAMAETNSPTHITLSDLREAEQVWMEEQPEDTSEVQILPSPTPEPVECIVLSDDEGIGSEQVQEEESEPEEDEDIIDLSSD